MYYELDLEIGGCLVRGGELCLWSELNNEHTVFQRIWSRSASLSERLWSEKRVEDKIDVIQRLVQFEQRLRLENIPFTKITSNWCEKHVDLCFEHL